MWGKYFVIFIFDDEAYTQEKGYDACDWQDSDSIDKNFTFIEFDSYSDNMFMNLYIKQYISVPNIYKYFINTNRNIDDVMMFIKMRCDFLDVDKIEKI
jgi:hypothetical protein